MSEPTDADLLGFVDEMLPVAAAAAIEDQLRTDPTLRERLQALLTGRHHGQMSIGEVWRQHRVTCPTQTELGLYLVHALSDEYREYIAFHVDTIGCIFCAAQLAEMHEALEDTPEQPHRDRRDTIYQSSAGLLRQDPPPSADNR